MLLKISPETLVTLRNQHSFSSSRSLDGAYEKSRRRHFPIKMYFCTKCHGRDSRRSPSSMGIIITLGYLKRQSEPRMRWNNHKPIMRRPAEMSAYVFLCDTTTEAECLNRKLVGATQYHAVRALNIRLGDVLFRYNFQNRILYGPLIAYSAPDCHEPEAWGGRFPVQVRFDLATGFRSRIDHTLRSREKLLSARVRELIQPSRSESVRDLS